jgi:hypothetical protein
MLPDRPAPAALADGASPCTVLLRDWPEAVSDISLTR